MFKRLSVCCVSKLSESWKRKPGGREYIIDSWLSAKASCLPDYTHTHTYTHTNTHSHTLTHTHTYTHSLTHTHTRTLHRCWEVAALLVTTVPSSPTSGQGPKTKFCPVECGRSDACYFQAWLSHPSLSPTGCQGELRSHLLWMAVPQSAWVPIYLCRSVHPHPHPHQC